jgi:uncharacterized protein YpmS
LKTIIALLTATMLVAGATSAMAYDRQATDDAQDFMGIMQAFGFDLPFAWALMPVEAPNSTVEVHNGAVEVRNSTVAVPSQHDFQMDGR